MRTVSFVVVLTNSQTSGRIQLGQTLPRCVALKLTEYYYATSAGGAQPPYIFEFGDGAFPQSETNSLSQQGFLLTPEFPREHHHYQDGRVVSDTPKSGNNSFSFTLRHVDGSVVAYDYFVLWFTALVEDRDFPHSDTLIQRDLVHRLGQGVTRSTRETWEGYTAGQLVSAIHRSGAPGSKF